MKIKGLCFLQHTEFDIAFNSLCKSGNYLKRDQEIPYFWLPKDCCFFNNKVDKKTFGFIIWGVW